MRGSATGGSAAGRSPTLRAPSLEPSPRRAGVDAARAAERRHVLQPHLPQLRDPLRRMPSRVEQHVRDRVPHLPRGLEHAVVIPIREHLPGAPERAVHREREERRDRLHPAPERLHALRLDDQVRVIVLDRVVDEPHLLPHAAAPKRGLDLPRDVGIAQRGKPRNHAQRDVARMLARERIALLVGHARVLALRPPGILVPTIELQSECHLLRAPHDKIIQRWYGLVKGTDRRPEQQFRQQSDRNTG